MGLAPSLAANALIVGTLVYAAVLNAFYPDLYHSSVQEDEYLEWATFWAFAFATGVWLWAAARQRRSTGRLPWFLAGVGLFCFFVAMEEISWAQRLFAYRPPAYFLEHNFQQEFNFHNVVATDLRKLALQVVLGGYGVLLAILAWTPGVRRLLMRTGVIAPPLELAPAFAVTLAVALIYPWKYTGEIVELMMGWGFLFAAMAVLAQFSDEAAPRRVRRTGQAVIAGAVLVLVLGLAAAATARYGRTHDPQAVELAAVEIDALRRDFLTMAESRREYFPESRNLHKRIYSYVKKYHGDYLHRGRFASLVEGGLPEERADFFLDPWNAPYWIKLHWNAEYDRVTALVYSFGPNRRRDSALLEIRGDDVGAFIYHDETFRDR